jgi:NADPH:quinone reductase-like Zn-dependent oxidoreductase
MSLFATMRHVATDGAGSADVMRIATGPVPTPGADDVLIKVAFAGVK